MKKLFAISLATGCLVACGGGGGGGNSSPTPPPPAPLTMVGHWQAPAYGKAMHFDGSTLSIYDYSSDYCQIRQQFSGISEDDLREEDYQLSQDKQSLQIQAQFLGLSQLGELYGRTQSLPTSCSNNLVAGLNQGGYQRSPSRDFEIFYQTFAEYYLNFSLRGVDWAERRTAVEGQINDNISDETLFINLAEMIRPIGDSHVKLIWPDQGLASFNGKATHLDRFSQEWLQANGPVDSAAKQTAHNNYIEGEINKVRTIRNAYAQRNSGSAANGLLSWYIGPNDIAVLMIDGLIGFSGEVDLSDIDQEAELSALEAGLDQAIAAIADSQGLILDLRLNGGGMDSAAQMVARRFLDTERHLYSKQAREGDSRTPLQEIRLAPHSTHYLKPLAVLTSTSTTSAAETLSLMLQGLPHATLMGEASQGALSDALSKKLPNGFEFWLANEYYLSPQGEWFEGRGIPVAQSVAFASAEQRDNEEDLGIETAYQFLISQ